VAWPRGWSAEPTIAYSRAMIVRACRQVSGDARFHNFVTGVIVAAGVVVGLETYPAVTARIGDQLGVLNSVILWIFVVEIAIKLVAGWPRPGRFFRDPWNVFDFVIVAAAFTPFIGEYATVLRLIRLLRVLRLLRAFPRLQLLVGALLKSIPSMLYVSMLLGLIFYIYAVAAVFLWRDNDPIHFLDLQTSLLSLFRVATLEDWTDIMYINMYGCDQYGYELATARCTSPSASPVASALFFSSFVMIATMIALNLFIGVIVNGMNEVQREKEAADLAERLKSPSGPDLEAELAQVSAQLEATRDQLIRLQALARASAKG
jgi:voltage-gated sodium channel